MKALEGLSNSVNPKPNKYFPHPLICIIRVQRSIIVSGVHQSVEVCPLEFYGLMMQRMPASACRQTRQLMRWCKFCKIHCHRVYWNAELVCCGNCKNSNSKILAEQSKPTRVLVQRKSKVLVQRKYIWGSLGVVLLKQAIGNRYPDTQNHIKILITLLIQMVSEDSFICRTAIHFRYIAM